jgi:Holliday junction resolvasome RuvABC DNA-binding subunit
MSLPKGKERYHSDNEEQYHRMYSTVALGYNEEQYHRMYSTVALGYNEEQYHRMYSTVALGYNAFGLCSTLAIVLYILW